MLQKDVKIKSQMREDQGPNTVTKRKIKENETGEVKIKSTDALQMVQKTVMVLCMVVHTLTLVDLSFFSLSSLSFSMSVILNRRSVTSWYKP